MTLNRRARLRLETLESREVPAVVLPGKPPLTPDVTIRSHLPPANGSLGTTYTFESPQHPGGELDNVWTEWAGSFEVATVSGNNVAMGNAPASLATLNGVSAADVVVQAQVKGLAAGQGDGLADRQALGLIARHTAGPGTGSGYEGRLFISKGTEVRAAIYRFANGAWTRLGSDVVVGPVVGVLNGTLRFEVAGTSLKLFLGNTLLAFARDTTFPAAGGVGMGTVGAAALDNFLADLAPAPANGSLPAFYTFESPQRADGQLDNVWTERVGNFKIVNASGNNVAMGNGPDNLTTLNGVSAANVVVQAQVKALAAGQALHLVARHAGPGLNNGYYARLYNVNGTVRASIYRNVNGTWTLLGSDVAVGPVAGVLNGTLKFEVQASSLKLFLGNTLLTFAHDMTFGAAGGVGMRTVGAASLDNFMANLAPAPANGSFGTTYTFESPQRPDGQLDNVWTERVGNVKVVNVSGSNVAMGNGTDNLFTLNGVSAANVFVQAQIKSLNAGENISLVARHSGPGLSNGYYGRLTNVNGTARASIYRNVNGTWTRLGTDVAVGPVAGVIGAVLRFEVLGNSLKLFVGGNLVSDVTDTSPSAITGPGGIRARLFGKSSLDNFLTNTLP